METTIVNYWTQCRDKWIIGSPAPIHTSLSMAQGRSWRGDIQTVREYQELAVKHYILEITVQINKTWTRTYQ